MKYSLKDFKRAADRHIGGMEPSAEGRARLTRKARPHSSPMNYLGWAAVAAACLVMVALLNLPLGAPDGAGPAPDAAGAPLAAPTQAAHPTQAAPVTQAAPTALPSASPAMPTASPSPSPDAPTASPDASRGLTARDSALLLARSDEPYLGYDYAGHAYMLLDTFNVFDEEHFAYNVETRAEDFYTLDEVLATEEGREYYGEDVPSSDILFHCAQWPRPEAATWLPDMSPWTWTRYYSELGVGVVQSLWAVHNDGLPRYGLASFDGLITEVMFTDIFGFTTDDVSIASVPALEGYSAENYRSYGVINARGEWVREPVAGELDVLSADLAGNGSDTAAYYLLRTYDNLELKRDAQTGTSHVDYDYGEVLIMDLSGNVLMTADEFGYMYVNSLTDSPIPYKDSATGLWGYVDMDLNTVIEPQYLNAQNFGGGLAAVQLEVEPGPETGWYDKLYGFIDETGALVIPPRYALVTSGFTDGGSARVWLPDDGSIEHAIDRAGNDVSSPISLAWQRLTEWRERVPLDARLSSWALIVLLAALIARNRLRGYPDGYNAEKRRLAAGCAGYLGFFAMYAALDTDMCSALPGLMLMGEVQSYEWLAYALVMGAAVLGGSIYGWAARARSRTWPGTALSCLAAAALPLIARWLMCMFTRMDVDAAAAFALGAAAGALLGRNRDLERISIRYRLACIALSAALALGALALDLGDFTPRYWHTTAACSRMELSISALDEADSLAGLRARADDPDIDRDYVEAIYGEDWPDKLDALIADPEGYAVLTIEMDALNPYPKAQSALLHAYFSPLPGADPNFAASLLAALYEYAPSVQCQLEPFARQTVKVSYLARVGDTPPDEWLDALKSCCRVEYMVY